MTDKQYVVFSEYGEVTEVEAVRWDNDNFGSPENDAIADRICQMVRPGVAEWGVSGGTLMVQEPENPLVDLLLVPLHWWAVLPSHSGPAIAMPWEPTWIEETLYRARFGASLGEQAASVEEAVKALRGICGEGRKIYDSDIVVERQQIFSNGVSGPWEDLEPEPRPDAPSESIMVWQPAVLPQDDADA